MNASPKRRAPWLLAAALLAPLAAGCLPNATWLPDSSGFVYTGGPKMDQLILCDASSGKTRVMVEKGVGPTWPAVSPEGKRIAVPILTVQSSDAAVMEAVVFDRNGKELHRSRKMSWIPDEFSPLQIFWAPGQDKLLLCTNRQGAIYDLEKATWTKLDLHIVVFGASPIRPDGKGFLASRPKDGVFVFVDWDGKLTEFEEKTKGLFAAAHHPGAMDRKLGDMLANPFLASSHWDGGTAVVSWDDLAIRIDAEKLTATRETIPLQTTADKKVIQDQLKLEGGAVIRVVETVPRYGKEQAPDNPLGCFRLEVLKPGDREPRTLAADVVVLSLLPSPDRTMAIVLSARATNREDQKKNTLYLINAKGDVAAALDVCK